MMMMLMMLSLMLLLLLMIMLLPVDHSVLEGLSHTGIAAELALALGSDLSLIGVREGFVLLHRGRQTPVVSSTVLHVTLQGQPISSVQCSVLQS
jgi:uncharacterized membrane protein